jgi:ParB family chromosome partitioning protein
MAKFERKPRVPGAEDAAAHSSVDKSLFGLSADASHRVVEVPLDRLDTNPHQPRTHFDDSDIAQLAASIDKHGLQSPVTVTHEPHANRYQLVAGERRLRAHRLLGRSTIVAIITTGNPAELALVENTQRVDLNVLELAKSMQALVETCGYRQQDLADMVGRDRTDVAKILTVLRLPADILTEFERTPTVASQSVMLEIAASDDPDQQREMWDRAKAGQLTVQAARTTRRNGAAPPAPTLPQQSLRALRTGLSGLAKKIDAVQSARAQLDDKLRREVTDLRNALDALLSPSAD